METRQSYLVPSTTPRTQASWEPLEGASAVLNSDLPTCLQDGSRPMAVHRGKRETLALTTTQCGPEVHCSPPLPCFSVVASRVASVTVVMTVPLEWQPRLRVKAPSPSLKFLSSPRPVLRAPDFLGPGPPLPSASSSSCYFPASRWRLSKRLWSLLLMALPSSQTLVFICEK